jgi:apolipoprotein N-acyltransferase
MSSVFPLSRGKAHALAFVSGFLYFLAFPGIDVWPLGFVALVPLFVALRGQRAHRGAAIGWTAGFTMTMCGFYWLLEMLRTFSGFGTPLCLLFMAILCAYQAGRIGLMGWIATRAEMRGWPSKLSFAVAFVASELTFPLLFPWAYAATVHQIPVLTQTAELGGPIAVGLVLLAANLALAELVVARMEKRSADRRVAGALALVPVVASLYGVIRIHQVDAKTAAAPKARVGVVQANMSLMGKRHDRFEGLRRHLALTNEVERGGKLDLVVWSETSVVAPEDEQLAPSAYRRMFTARLGIPAIFGAVLVREVPDAREYILFNAALLSNANGDVVGRYDKQYLLAFGEYLPFGDEFPSLYEISRNSGHFSPGKTVKPLRLDGHGIATFICYEDIIASFVRKIVNAGDTDLLVNITNDAWFGDSTEPWIHLALAQFRAIEHRRFLVRSTNSGVSAFVDPVGRVQAHTGTFKQQSIASEIAWLRATTGYELWGDAPWWLTTLVALGFVIRTRPGHRDRRSHPPKPKDDEPSARDDAKPDDTSEDEEQSEEKSSEPDGGPADSGEDSA